MILVDIIKIDYSTVPCHICGTYQYGKTYLGHLQPCKYRLATPLTASTDVSRYGIDTASKISPLYITAVMQRQCGLPVDHIGPYTIISLTPKRPGSGLEVFLVVSGNMKPPHPRPASRKGQVEP